MFSIKSIDGKLDILHNSKSVIKDIVPFIHFEDEPEITPVYKDYTIEEQDNTEGKGTKYHFEYAYNDGKVSLALDMICRDELLITEMSLTCEAEQIGGKDRGLLPVGGIGLKVGSISNIQGGMANYMHKDWWTRPYFGKDAFELPPKTQSLLWKTEDEYYHLLPVCDDLVKTELSGNGQGVNITISPYDGGCSNFRTLAFVLGNDTDPFDLSGATTTSALDLLPSAGQTRKYRRYPDMLEYLGWCSWDAFYYEINSKGILEKAQEFKEKKLPVKWFIIDAGWSDDTDMKLKSFGPHKDKFTEGLKAVISQLKAEFGAKWVGVWHTILGYWGGIDPESQLAKEYRDSLYTTKSGNVIPYPEASKAFTFWNAWHSYLKKQGVDFVKVDYQSALVNFLKNNFPIGKAAKEAHEALEASVGKNFDNRLINCMGMAAENIWHRPISGISRNSDDFYPNNEGSFKEHALQNAYNSFYTSNFIWGDWDMWWTKHQDSINNAVLRAVSGGPVYVSDPLNTTEAQKIYPLILSDGRILRCDNPGLPTEDCLFKNPCEEDVPLKVWNKSGIASFIATFNINLQGKRVNGTISPSDIPRIEGESFAVYEHFSRKLTLSKREEILDIALEDNNVSLYEIVPMTRNFAPLGLVNKYISAAAISNYNLTEDRAIITLKEGGEFAFVCQSEPKRVLVNGCDASYTKNNLLYIVECSGGSSNILFEIEF